MVATPIKYSSQAVQIAAIGKTNSTRINNSTGSASVSQPKEALFTPAKQDTPAQRMEANFQSISGATWYVSGAAEQGNLVQKQITPPTQTPIWAGYSYNEYGVPTGDSYVWQNPKTGTVSGRTTVTNDVLAAKAGSATFTAPIIGSSDEKNWLGLDGWQMVAVLGIAVLAGTALVGKWLK